LKEFDFIYVLIVFNKLCLKWVGDPKLIKTYFNIK